MNAQDPARRVGLQRRKLEPAGWVTLDDELDEPVAQVADAIEQDQLVSWQLHR